MATTNSSDFIRRLTRGMAAETLDDHSDRQLVERALAGRDEAAFQTIVHRHGPMVYRVCWRVLLHLQDAEEPSKPRSWFSPRNCVACANALHWQVGCTGWLAA